eukprot:gene27482-36260_t
MLLGRAQGFHLRRESPLFSTKSLYMGSSEYDKYTIAILGDLHLDPRFMDDHLEGRDHFLKILEDGNRPNSCVVSLGDLGESKPVFPDSSELFSGTTKCFQLSREYLDGFKVPFEVIGGNHDLEGIDEFPTDGSNLAAYLKILGKPSPNFLREISPKVLLLGLGSVLFRNAQYTSHEVFIDEKQIDWFEEVARTHPTEEGFIEIVRANPCIKAWFSGHFHLGQDYEDSLTIPKGNNRGDCTFVQTSVMSRKSTRDGRRQSRLRLDATITFDESGCEKVVVVSYTSEDYDRDKFFSALTPSEGEGCYLPDTESNNETSEDELQDRQIAIIDSGIEANAPDSPLYKNREQAVVLYTPGSDENVTVIHPNEDGSYWRKIVRNKVVRMREKRREKAAQKFIIDQMKLSPESKVKVTSSWGPYISTDGTAKKTKVPGT